MTPSKITAGLLVPAVESLKPIRNLAEATGSISVEVESERYCSKPGDQSTREFVHARPEIILVDMEDPQAAIASLETLHAALPETCLFAVSQKTDPKLIMEAVHAGAREFFPKPIQAQRLMEAIARHVAEKQRMIETLREGKVYCVTSGKEGSGATTVAINLASFLAEVRGTRVALVDLDSPAGDAAMYLNLQCQHTSADALAAGTRLDSLLLESFMTQADGVSVLSTPREYRGQRSFNVDALARLLKVASETYTHTVIDLPRSLSIDHLKVVTRIAEVVVMVVTPDLASISRTGHLLRHLSVCDVSEKIRLVINRSRSSADIDDSQIERALHHTIFCRIPENHKESAKAIMSGKPLVRGNDSAFASCHRELSRQLAGIPKPQGARRLLGEGWGGGSLKAAFASIFSFLRNPLRPLRSAERRRQKAGFAQRRLGVNLRN